MNIIQFTYKPLSHFSYAIISNDEIAIVDPERNPYQYYALAKKHNAKIVAVFETHPHADFVSSHLQIHKETGATIYTSEKVNADYPHKTFDSGDTVTIGDIEFSAVNSPGHSPDSITVIATQGEDVALFTGDTLFVGDVGRPDLREGSGHLKATRKAMAKSMYKTINKVYAELPDHALVYPAHGAGSLCGKGMSSNSTSSTLGNERLSNWAFNVKNEGEFMSELLDDQPFIPKYFNKAVSINKDGASNYDENFKGVIEYYKTKVAPTDALIIDIRDEKNFKDNHLKGSYNIMAMSPTSKFETWLGSIVNPDEEFYIVLENSNQAASIYERVTKIGYEKQIKGFITLAKEDFSTSKKLDLKHFKKYPDTYTIVDIRNKSEVANQKLFPQAINIPLHELRENIKAIPTIGPIIVHCAGGYRSAAGSSIILAELDTDDIAVYDLSDAVKDFS